MFYLNFIPDSYLLSVINAVLLASVIGLLIGFLITFIPWLRPYRPLINIISTVLLALSMYFKGSYGADMEWRARAEELKKQIADAEERARQVNVRIETQVVEKVKIIKERVNDNKKSIQVQKQVINADCVIPDVARVLYNNAVDNEISGGTGESDASSTEVRTTKSK